MKKNIAYVLVVGFVLAASLASPGSAGAKNIQYTPYLMLNGEYNDNILFRRDDKRDDFLYNIAPALRVNYVSELLELESDFGTMLRRYTTEDEFDREDYYVNLLGRYSLTERLSTRARFYFLQDNTLESTVLDIEDPVFIEDGDIELDDGIDPGIERFYSERKRYNGNVAFDYRLTELSHLELGYRYLKSEYDFEGNTDFDVHRLRLEYLKRLQGERDTLGARVDYGQYSSEISDADTYALALIWRHAFSETMRLKADIGVRYTDRTFNNRDDQTENWTGLADIRFTKTGETTKLALGFKQDLQSGSDGTIANLPRLYANLSQGLTERFLFQIKSNLYLRRDDIDFDFGDGDVFFDIIPSLKYRLTENYALTMAYSYTFDHDRDLDENPDKERNRVWLMLELEFPQKL